MPSSSSNSNNSSPSRWESKDSNHSLNRHHNPRALPMVSSTALSLAALRLRVRLRRLNRHRHRLSAPPRFLQHLLLVLLRLRQPRLRQQGLVLRSLLNSS